CLQDYTLPWTF
nr:immunoglobulin light chain junction region [Macaca mulatta]MOV64291.1 immunoglobulin light chain junction region [Macaca mulatta]